MMRIETQELCSNAIIGETAFDILRRHGKEKTPGTFLGVFSRAVYCDFGGDVLMLCGNAAGVIPLGISLEEDIFTRFRAFAEKMKDGRIYASEEGLSFENVRLVISYGAPLCAPSASALFLPDLLKALSDFAACADGHSLSPLVSGKVSDGCPAAVSAALEKIPALANALTAQDPKAVLLSVRQLAGLGCGLTPSCDDLLSGMLYTFGYFSSVSEKAGRCFSLLKASVLVELSRTSGISAAYLRCAAALRRFDAVHSVLEALCGKGELAKAARSLGSFGASSGIDMTCGIILACRCL